MERTATGSETEQAALLPEETIHTGDIVLLQAGDVLTADIKLLEAAGLEVDEWELSGELMPVEKRVDGEATYLYRGSRVTRGSGKGVVVATGAETEYGEILKQRWEGQKLTPPPFVRAKHCILPLLLAVLVAALGRNGNGGWVLLRYLPVAVAIILLQNHELFRYLLTAGETRHLAAQGIILRDKTCLGAASDLDVMCFDKTGVLTTLGIEVRSLQFASEGPQALPDLSESERGILTGIACALCNDVFFLERVDQAHPMDAALMSFALRQGFDIASLSSRYSRIYDKPFDSEDRYMAAGFQHGDHQVWFAKGDPEVVLRMCTHTMTAAGTADRINTDFLRTIRVALNAAKQKADLVLALACSQDAGMPPDHVVFLCLIFLQNPLRASAPACIRAMGALGIRSVMLTGDRAETALTVGHEAGIGQDATYLMTGKDLARMPLQEVARQAEYVSIFARLLPSQKGLLVRLLQRRGHRVGMLGDGANDTVALRVAEVGISFNHISSPRARKVSRILIDELADVITVITSARRIEQRIRCLGVLRAIAWICAVFVLFAALLK